MTGDKMFYSASTKGFYDAAIHNVIPADAVEISSDEYAAALAEQAMGKSIVVKDGLLALIDPPAPSAADLATARSAEILAELVQIDADSARPARAIALATTAGEAPDIQDVSKLQALEARAVVLRAELSSLSEAV